MGVGSRNSSRVGTLACNGPPPTWQHAPRSLRVRRAASSNSSLPTIGSPLVVLSHQISAQLRFDGRRAAARLSAAICSAAAAPAESARAAMLPAAPPALQGAQSCSRLAANPPSGVECGPMTMWNLFLSCSGCPLHFFLGIFRNLSRG